MSVSKKWIPNIILVITGILFLLLIVSMTLFYSNNKFIYFWLPVLVMCLAVLSAIINLKTIKRGYIIFLSGLAFLSSLWIFLMKIGFVSGTLKNWWPLLGVFSSIALIGAGYLHYRKLHFGFIIPSVVLLIMGSWFLMFSLKIITIPFIDVVLICGPLLLLLCFVLLFVLFYYQKVTKSFVIKDDEYNHFEDDCYNPPKND